MALGGALGSVLVAGDAAALCVAGVALVLRGRRGTISHPRSFCLAGVALMALGGALGSVLVAGDAAALCVGRHGTWSHPLSYCVAGVAQSHIHPRFAWQAVRFSRW